MPKTIAITPSWYWPEHVDRVAGIPPYGLHEICLQRHVRDKPDQPALITDEGTLTYADLGRRINGACGQLAEAAGSSIKAKMSGECSRDSIIRLLAALSLGMSTRLQAPGDPAATEPGVIDLCLIETDGEATERPDPVDPVEPIKGGHVHAMAVAIQGRGGVAMHTHRSLLAGAISMATFLQPCPDRHWLITQSLDRWEGLLSLFLPLYLGEAVVVPAGTDGESIAAAIERHQPGYGVVDLAQATAATRDAKRAVKKARDVLNGLLLSTPGVFDPGDRQRVGKSFRCPALTLYGLPETGAIFAAHPQWYMDESIGIPITNAHVVPADPRNGTPIQTLWELVESAEVTVKGPGLMSAYEDRNDQDYLAGGRFRTGVIASSDANGMIYILPD